MTAEATTTSPGGRRPLPYWAHVVAGLVVALAFLLVTRPGAIINADEGAALIQSQTLHEHGVWGMANPNPELDPDGRWFPVDLTARDGDAWYPYTKHVVYPIAIGPLLALGGVPLVLAVHALALGAAAATIGLVTRRVARRFGMDERLDRVGLWATLVGSAAVFDAFWVIAHSPGLFAAATAVLGVVVVADGATGRSASSPHPPTGRTHGFAAGAALATAGSVSMVLLRSEGTLFGVAVAAALGLLWLFDVRQVRHLALSAIVGAATVATYVADGKLEQSARPSGGKPFTIDHGGNWLSTRTQGLANSVLRPDLTGEATAMCLVVIGAAAVVAAWSLARRDERLARAAAVVGAGAYVLRLLLADGMIAGLLPASPLLLAGLCAVDRRILRDAVARTLLVAAGLYAGAIVATQYAAGGTGDWGGRYFRLGLAAVIPVLVVALAARAASLPRPTARALTAGLVVAAVACTGAALRNAVDARSVVAAAVERVQGEATVAGEGRPVVVTTRRELGRFSWEHLDDSEMLYVADLADLRDIAASLADGGVEGFVFVGYPDELDDATAVVDGYEVEAGSRRAGGSWSTERYRRTGGL